MLHISFLLEARGRFLDGISQNSTSLPLFLGQSQVIAVDKEEAAVSLTQENAQRYVGWDVQKASTGWTLGPQLDLYSSTNLLVSDFILEGGMQ